MDAPRRSPDDPRDLLAAYRDVERMPAAARAAAWRDIQAGLHAPKLLPVRRRKLAPVIWGAVLLAAAVLLLLVRPAALAPTPTTVDPQAAHDVVPSSPTSLRTPARLTAGSSPPDEPAGSISPASTTNPVSAGSVAPPVIAQPAPRRPREPARTTESLQAEPLQAAPPLDPPVPPLERELALLRAARDALARADADAALIVLAEHAAEFPSGHLREERLVLRVEALCAAGSRDDARREATSFAQAHPDSPHARKLQRVCP